MSSIVLVLISNACRAELLQEGDPDMLHYRALTSRVTVQSGPLNKLCSPAEPSVTNPDSVKLLNYRKKTNILARIKKTGQTGTLLVP